MIGIIILFVVLLAFYVSALVMNHYGKLNADGPLSIACSADGEVVVCGYNENGYVLNDTARDLITVRCEAVPCLQDPTKKTEIWTWIKVLKPGEFFNCYVSEFNEFVIIKNGVEIGRVRP